MYYLVMEEKADHPIDMNRVRELMQIRGIKRQAELARRAGLDPSTLSRLFKPGERESGSADTLSALAKALGTTVDYIKGASDEPRRSDAKPLPDYALEVMETMRRLGHTQRYELLTIAKALAEKNNEREVNFLRDVNELFIQFAEDGGKGEDFSQHLKRLMNKSAPENDGDNSSRPTDKNNDKDADSPSEPI